MSVSEFQDFLRECRTTIRACGHNGDYAVLYDDVDMDHLLCHSCWNKEVQARIDADTVKIFRPNQLRAVRVRCLRCDTDVTAQKNCESCFPARQGQSANP